MSLEPQQPESLGCFLLGVVGFVMCLRACDEFIEAAGQLKVFSESASAEDQSSGDLRAAVRGETLPHVKGCVPSCSSAAHPLPPG
mmetsp:Transcript_43419/g.116554  ORF Transcript_43419/g.116554 Transcript_43419/m.116554 type:complete len:85 (+) Transcript_43419:1508-1762(+)